MQICVRVKDGLTVIGEGKNQEEAFRNLAAAQDTYQDSECGVCGCKELKYVVRDVEGVEFFELRCQKYGCWAKLAFGKHKDGSGMYPKRMKVETEGKNKGKVVIDETTGKGVPLGKNGWVKYNKETGKEE